MTIVGRAGVSSRNMLSGGRQYQATSCVALRGDAYVRTWGEFASQEADGGWAGVEMHQSNL